MVLSISRRLASVGADLCAMDLKAAQGFEFLRIAKLVRSREVSGVDDRIVRHGRVRPSSKSNRVKYGSEAYNVSLSVENVNDWSDKLPQAAMFWHQLCCSDSVDGCAWWKRLAVAVLLLHTVGYILYNQTSTI